MRNQQGYSGQNRSPRNLRYEGYNNGFNLLGKVQTQFVLGGRENNTSVIFSAVNRS